MTAHVLVPVLDPDRPASLSPAIVQGLLKDALGYGGVVISDDLGMKAVSATEPLPEASVAAVAAGCDMVLMCNSTVDAQVEALEALIHAVESGHITERRIDDAFARQHRTKVQVLLGGSLAPQALDVVGCAAHQAVAREMAAWQ